MPRSSLRRPRSLLVTSALSMTLTTALALASGSGAADAASYPAANRPPVGAAIPLPADSVATSTRSSTVDGATTPATQASPAVPDSPAVPVSPATPVVVPASPSAQAALSGSIAPGAPPSAGAVAPPLRRVPVSTSAQLQNAIATARPGDWITLAGGTYTGPFMIFTSGTAAHPVVITTAPGASATLTATLPMPSCGASGPDDNRTIRISRGASHWVIQGLAIKGGLMVSSTGASETNHWIVNQVNTGDWRARRAVPGRGSNTPSAAGGAAAYLSKLVHNTVLPSDDIQVVNNVITGKGVFSRFGRYGVLDGNTITNIACGTGPGVWLANYSDAWTITRNDVSNVASSSYSHFMQEGIRLGTASSYNLVTVNTVHDLPTIGRGITSDVDGSWNVFSHNTVTNVDIGYNDEQSGWGNTWDHNTSVRTRTAGFSFRMKDAVLPVPSMNTSTNLAQVSCNVADGSSRGLQAGAMMNSAFTSNSFRTVFMNPRLRGYWGAQGDRWDGRPTPPTETPANSTSGC